MRSSARRRSVMSSWVATHPPSASGSLTTWTERPSGVVMTIAFRWPMSRSTRSTYWSTSPVNDPVCLAVGDHVAETAARLDDIGRQAVHVEIALVADDEALRRIEQQQALRHVVDGGVEPLLFQRQPLPRPAVLLRELADDQEQQRGDGEHGQAGHRDQDADLFAPVGQRRRGGRRRDDHDRKFAQAREEIKRSSPSSGLVRREVVLASSKTCCWLAGPVLKFLPIISSRCG